MTHRYKPDDPEPDPLHNYIEKTLLESGMSYSAFLDEQHRQYVEAARKVRSKRRSITIKDSPSDSPEDSPSDSPDDSPNDSQRNSPRTGLNIIEGIPDAPRDILLDGSKSDLDLIEDLSFKASGDSSDNSSDVIVIDTNRTKTIDQTRSVLVPGHEHEPNTRLTRSSIPSSNVARFAKVDYESDITSDGKGLLREFGDSELSSTSTSIRHADDDFESVERSSKNKKEYAQSLLARPAPAKVTDNLFDLADFDDLLAMELESCSAIISSEIDNCDSKGLDMSNSGDDSNSSVHDILSELENEITMSIGPVHKTHKKAKTKKEKSQGQLDQQNRNTRGARRMSKWVNDESVATCYGCNDPFTGYFSSGIHHCRLCGRAFCQRCSRYKTVLPMDILMDIPDRPESYTDFLFGDDPNGKVRVCADCYKYASDLIRNRKLIKVFEICGFNLIELKTLSRFNPDWKKAANFCIERFRGIQYKLSIETLRPIEKRYIWINRHLLSRHSRWMVLLFKSCDMSDPRKVDELQRIVQEPKKVDCRRLGCSRFCSDEIQLGDMLDLIKYNNNNPVISEYVIDCISRIDGETLMDYLPFLVTNAVNNHFLIQILLEKSKGNFALMTHVYWCIKSFIPDKKIRRNSIVQALRFIKENSDYDFSLRFKTMIKNEKLNMDWIKLQNEQLNRLGDIGSNNRKIVVPVCPDHDFDSIDVDGIKVMDSNSRPVIIPFRKGKEDKLIMYKEDDVRKDYVILGIINIIHRLLNRESGIHIDTVKYKVMPTSEGTGYIEIVENAQTIYDIIQTNTIQNYILNHNQAGVVKDVKDRFIKSTALYCVISYLFGFGDRHLENIMISEEGLLFHIDFGYILGQDPKYTTNKSLRVTPEIINVIGGEGTDNHRKFGNYCMEIYSCLRMHVNLFSNLLSVVPLIDPYISEDMIRHEIFDRFEVGEDNLEAAAHMDLKVRRDSGSFDYMIIDFLHRSKNSPLFKGLKYVKGAILGRVYSNGS